MLGGIGRSLPAVIAGIGLAISGAWSTQAVAAPAATARPATAHAAVALKPVVGQRIAGHHPFSAFAASPKHLQGPRRAVLGKVRPPRLIRPTRIQRAESAAMTRARLTGRPVVPEGPRLDSRGPSVLGGTAASNEPAAAITSDSNGKITEYGQVPPPGQAVPRGRIRPPSRVSS